MHIFNLLGHLPFSPIYIQIISGICQNQKLYMPFILNEYSQVNGENFVMVIYLPMQVMPNK